MTASTARRVTIVLWILAAVLFFTFVALAAVLLIRSGVFDPDVAAISTEQSKLVWAFLGACLASLATLMGALLTEQTSRRTAAAVQEAADRQHDLEQKRLLIEKSARLEQEVSAKRKEVLEQEAENRQTVDTVVKVVQIMTEGDSYAHSARVTAALLTLVALRQERIALQLLSRSWTEGAIDADGATTIIDQVIAKNDPRLAETAAFLLLSGASSLAGPVSGGIQGAYSWPEALSAPMPSHFTENARWLVQLAVGKMLVSRDVQWWGNASVHDMYQLLASEFTDPDEHSDRDTASAILKPLLSCALLVPAAISGRTADELRNDLQAYELTREPVPLTLEIVSKLELWVATGKAQAETSAPSPVQPNLVLTS